MKKFLFDSDFIIWYLGGRENEIKFLQELSKVGDFYISVVTITEVRTGLTKDKAKIIKLLKDTFTPLPVTENIAELAGVFKQKYRLDIADMMIAATAVITQSKLVTYNKKHFPMREIKLL